MHSAALPGGSSRLEEGLPFNGSNWIATGYCPTASDLFECEVTVDAAQPGASAAVFGTVRELEPERTFAFYVRQDGVDSSVVAYGGAARGGFFPRGEKVSLTVGPDGATWTWDGGFERLSLTPGFACDGVTPLLIGDANTARNVGDSVPAGTGAVMTLHRFRIWRGRLELVHDYEPCLDETGRYGVYDAVRREFLPCGREIGFAVNGRDVGFLWQGADWTYFHGVLSLTNATTYVLSGLATNDEVQVRAHVSGTTAVLSNAAVFASGRRALDVAQGAVLTVAADEILKTGNTPEELRYVQSYNGEPCVLSALAVSVTPGVPVIFDTAAEATNAAKNAVLTPRSDVEAKLGKGSDVLETYCNMFDFAVLPTSDGKWAVVAGLKPEAWSNLVESAQAATRQIDVAGIAALELGVPTDVTVTNCVPGFYYTIYGGSTVTNLKAFVSEKSRNVLCEPGKPVKFSEVVKPSDAAGFFSIGVKAAPGVTDANSDIVRNVAKVSGGGLYLEGGAEDRIVEIRGVDTRIIGNTAGESSDAW